MIAIAGILAALVGFGYSSYMITPQYSSSVLLYVNNSSINLGVFDISAADLTASQGLIKTYTELLRNRTTLERVIDRSGVDYTYGQLRGMVSASSLNGTEIMKVTVTGPDASEAADIANCIAEVLPSRIAEIIDGASMEVVDSAIPNSSKVSPNITRYTAMGLFLGVFAACAVIIVFALMDDTIHDEDYVLTTYKYPILAKIPNLMHDNSHHGYRYYRKTRYYEYKKSDKDRR